MPRVGRPRNVRDNATKKPFVVVVCCLSVYDCLFVCFCWLVLMLFLIIITIMITFVWFEYLHITLVVFDWAVSTLDQFNAYHIRLRARGERRRGKALFIWGDSGGRFINNKQMAPKNTTTTHTKIKSQSIESCFGSLFICNLSIIFRLFSLLFSHLCSSFGTRFDTKKEHNQTGPQTIMHFLLSTFVLFGLVFVSLLLWNKQARIQNARKIGTLYTVHHTCLSSRERPSTPALLLLPHGLTNLRPRHACLQ